MREYTISQVFEIPASEIEAAISEVFGFEEYNLAAEEEVSNGYAYVCDTTEPIDEYEAKVISKALKKKKPKPFRTNIYLKHLASIGEFPVGSYNIDVSW